MQTEREREDGETGYCRSLASERTRTQNPGSVISVDESVSRKSWRSIANDARSNISHSRQTQRELASDERNLREHLERRARQAVKGESSAQRQLYSTEYDMSHKESLNPRDNNGCKQVNGQIMLNEREFTCVASWSERIVFIKRATQEVAKKLKN